jgi:heme oxygenase
MNDHDSSAARASGCPFSRTPGPERVSLADMLREKTRAAHTRAEQHPRQARLVTGQATRLDYAAWLGQMLRVWRAVDAAISQIAGRDARIAAMVKPYHPHADRVAADLAFLGQTPATFPAVPAAERFVAWLDEVAARGDAAVVGAWYVLEGSSNGGRYIAKALSRALSIPGPAGLTSLDPHAEAQRERWLAWRADLDAQGWSDTERDGIVAAAARTFDAITEIMDDMDRVPATETAREARATA